MLCYQYEVKILENEIKILENEIKIHEKQTNEKPNLFAIRKAMEMAVVFEDSPDGIRIVFPDKFMRKFMTKEQIGKLLDELIPIVSRRVYKTFERLKLVPSKNRAAILKERLSRATEKARKAKEKFERMSKGLNEATKI